MAIPPSAIASAVRVAATAEVALAMPAAITTVRARRPLPSVIRETAIPVSAIVPIPAAAPLVLHAAAVVVEVAVVADPLAEAHALVAVADVLADKRDM